MSSYTSETQFGGYGELEDEGQYGEYESEYGEHEGAGLLSEAQEAGLAAELLNVNNEAELEQFLGGLISKIGKAAGGFIRSPVGQALGGILKDVAKKALPMVGGALGSMVAPGVGTALGSQLGSAASNMFELELEAMPQDEAEFEVAKRVVGLTAAAASHAAQAPPNANPKAVAREAVAQAAREYAPGLHRQMTQRSGRAAGATGRTRAAGRGNGTRRTSQWAGQQRMRPGGNGGFVDFAFNEPSADWDADGGGSFAAEDADGTRPMAGRWVRRGRRIILLGI